MLNVTFYYSGKNNAVEYDQVREWIRQLQETIPVNILPVDIDQDNLLGERYQGKTPVIEVGPYVLQWPVTQERLAVAVGAARDRIDHLEKIGDKAYETRRLNSQKWSKADRFAYWFSRHYLLVFNTILFLYVGIPFLGPVFMKLEMPGAAKVVYTIYRPLCHQFAYRSFFLFGAQPFYPRELAHIQDEKTYEQVTGNDPHDVLAARDYVGNAQTGYKVALCERDVAIWGALFLFGVIFALSKQKIHPLSALIWLLIGVIPMGLDGGSQLLGVLGNLPAWLPVRESTPFLRMLTGTLFGITTAWMIFPIMEENMRDTRKILTQKSASMSNISAKSD